MDVYEIVTNRIIEEMEKGIIPWQRPWVGSGQCINYVTRKPYSVLNEMLLGQTGEYVTFKQCKKLKGNIKKGAKSKTVVFFEWVVKEEEKNGEKVVDKYPILKYYNVFHLSDCDGIQSKLDVTEMISNSPIEDAERIINEYEWREKTLKIYRNTTSGQAFYQPSSDKIVVPTINQYPIVEEYYSTLFHEMVHSTGIKKRCDRGLEVHAAFGSENYSKEELVAEIGSAMLVNKVCMNAEKAFKNSVAYIQSWLTALKNDKRLVVSASAKAKKGVQYILNEKEEEA